jgi:hypothetical protein
MFPSIIPDLQVSNLNVVGQCSLPTACVGDAQFTGAGSTALQAVKVQQQRTYTYSQNRNVVNAADWQIVQLIYGTAGTLVSLRAKLPVACGAGSTVTVTWRLNGTSVGTVTFTNADPANTLKTATPSPTAVVAGDDLSVQITVSGGSPGQGIAAYFLVNEFGS